MAGRNPDDFPGRWITVTEAIGIFGVSERTIRRRIATCLLPTKHEGGRVLIYLYDTTPEESQAGAGNVAEANLEAEVRRLTGLLSQVENERDYLRQALEREQAVNMANTQKLIEAQASQPGAGDPESKLDSRRRWWEFWKG
jgi:hypothetical protein